MIDMITGAFGGLKSAAELAQSLLTLKTDSAVSTKAVELNRIIFDIQQKMFSIQADYAALLSRTGDLEAEIRDLKNWEEEKQRYQLHELVPGTFTHRLKPDCQGSEPLHDLCENCYQNGVKSILQAAGHKGSYPCFICPKCKSEYLAERQSMPSYVVSLPSNPRTRF